MAPADPRGHLHRQRHRWAERAPGQTWWITILTGTVVNPITIQIPIPIATLTHTPEGQLVSGGEDALATSLTSALTDTVLIALALVGVAALAVIVRRVGKRQTELLFTSQPA